MAKLKAKEVVEKELGLEELIPQFFATDSQQKVFKKEADGLKTKAKEKMASMGVGSFEVGNLVATLSTQDRSSLNPEKLLERVKELGFTSAIKTKEYIDEAAVEDLIYKGQMSADQIADCMEPNTIYVFSVKAKKAPKVAK